jgi:sulfate permease, SulP family
MLLGRNPYMSLGPESTVALMAAAAVAPIATAYNVPWTTALAVTTALVGIVLGIGWLLKASFLADLLSNPPPHRLSDRVAILMIISQLPKTLGYDLDTGSIAGLVNSQWHAPDWHTVTIAATVVIVAFACRAISNRIPGPLIGLVAATIMGQFMDVPEVGPVSLELPVLHMTGLSVQVIAALLVPALSIAVVSFTDVMITSRAFASEAMPDASSEMRALAATQFATGVAGG